MIGIDLLNTTDNKTRPCISLPRNNAADYWSLVISNKQNIIDLMLILKLG